MARRLVLFGFFADLAMALSLCLGVVAIWRRNIARTRLEVGTLVRKTRNWDPMGTVMLNPEREHDRVIKAHLEKVTNPMAA